MSKMSLDGSKPKKFSGIKCLSITNYTLYIVMAQNKIAQLTMKLITYLKSA